MTEPNAPTFIDNTSAGHLSVHLDPSRAADIPFLLEQNQKRLGPAFLTSFGGHAAVVLLGYLLIRFGGHPVPVTPVFPSLNPDSIIWLSQPGPGGGGGGDSSEGRGGDGGRGGFPGGGGGGGGSGRESGGQGGAGGDGMVRITYRVEGEDRDRFEMFFADGTSFKGIVGK